MAKIVLLLVFVAFVQTAYSLQCYNCMSNPNNRDCEDLKNVREISCGENTGDRQVACLKKTMYDTQSKMENITRACLIVTDKEVHCRTPSNRYEIKYCDLCTNDLCNSVGKININHFGLLAPIAYIVYKTLSSL